MLVKGEVITGLNVHEGTFRKSEPTFVPGRPHHALTFRKCGKISISTEDGQLISTAGCVTFVPKGTAYHTEILESGSMIVVHFTTVGGSGLNNRPEVFIPDHVTAIRNQFLALKERYKVGREQDYACMSMFYDILASIQYEQTSRQRAAIPQRMHTARRCIERSYGDPNLTVASLASAAGVSEAYFRREFKHYFDTTPSAYLKKIRLDNAKLLLSSGYYSVSEVARQCGFDSLSYFSYEFHRLTGKTPTEGRE